MLKLAKKIFGTQNDRILKGIQPTVAIINSLEEKMRTLTDAQLQAKTGEFKERLSKGENLDSLLPEAFATVREASWRVLKLRQYDVQLIGGYILHQGSIAEMKTGEGKTLVATLPVYINGLTGKGAHVVTVNDYLAKRDAEWMGQVYRYLGLSVGTIVHGLSDTERKESYRSDVTYGTNNEFGFDYLRDNMKFRLEDYVLKELNYCIVDEVDSILIDEARTPLIISGPTDGSTKKYNVMDKIGSRLSEGSHYTVDEKSKSATLTDEGIAEAERLLDIKNLYDPSNIDTLHHIQQAIKAHALFKRDTDYMVQDGKVVIVDEFTGRIMPGRRWSDGLHQAVEAKEGVEVENENQTLASITFQNFFRMYNKLSGMTGTADTEAGEFKNIYKLDVVVIPTHMEVIRKDRDDLIYRDVEAKYKAIVEKISECHEKNQPVLVGTISVQNSERLSQALKKANVPHHVLNAKHHSKEASIISQAGRPGAVTIATNMAGRGTDIKLGGDPEMLASLEVKPESPEYNKTLEKYNTQCAAEREIVLEAGGLFILGTERHESRRIDNQLRGRSGRQGDAGASRFFLSLQDDLFRIFGGDRIKALMGSSLENDSIEHPWLSRAIEKAQKKVENHNFDIRKHLLQYDDVMNQQRQVIYGLRRSILEKKELDSFIENFMEYLAGSLSEEFALARQPMSDIDFPSLNQAIQSTLLYPIEINLEELKGDTPKEALYTNILGKLQSIYKNKKEELGDYTTEVVSMLTLSTIDQRWKEHLLHLDHLREGINLRSYAQKDPLLEYKKESFYLFQNLQSQIKQEILRKIFNVQLRDKEAEKELERYERERQQEANMLLQQGTPDPGASATVENKAAKVGRNDPCPCGSGKKYKKCHGK